MAHGIVHVEIPTKDRDFDPTYTLFDPGRKAVGGGIYKVGSIPTKSPVRAYVPSSLILGV